MKRAPLASQKYAPWARWTKRGVPPTARKARTGEFTPPGISARARSNSCSFLSMLGVMGGEVEDLGGGGFLLVVGFPGARLGPEQAVRDHVAHARAETAIEAAVQVSERLHGGGGQVGPARHQRGEGARQGVAGAGEDGVEALELLA